MSETILETILNTVAVMTVEGVQTKALDEAAAALIRTLKVEPAFLGYIPDGSAVKGYPNVLCVSINGEVIHGIPGDRKIEDGDVVKLDCGIKLPDGQYDDGAVTVLIGDCSSVARRLVKCTKQALEAGVAVAKAGNTNHDIAKAIEAVVTREGFAVIHGYGGHGISTVLHDQPHIPNEMVYKDDGKTPVDEPVVLTSGMRLAIEPMVSSKRGFVTTASDGWTVKLIGGGVAAHFERTIKVK